ncbi:MAG: ATP synthase subunit delta, sodium ion specific [Deltaproteobacteria bacterium ADurb.BinA179]|nr:F0F1 ATP synthase subunit delta [Deltaproteobacteria bacterium]MDI9542977.1 ATP synthase F1 subunit delta [Pseudomonadota bacterium]OPZ24861.1 MAG: ATP synthase subunit delta, sodium ion specific [Deltaproteobacteria bacterium ADurb.BinA179]HOD70819.1 ATP synthase F1 subunit delta [Deltaproteobacteria bacterium]HOE72319.1 ATP synthase F1 subunit delta [Deltaproteobacteria bacterium]
MKSDVVARRYARALFELGQEEGKEKQFLDELQTVAQLVNDCEDLRSLLESPLYDITLKRRVLKEVASKISLSAYMMNFLNILLDKDRFPVMGEILDAYKEILDKLTGRVRARVTCATSLNEDQLKQVAQTLSKVVKKEVDVDVIVEPSLIGGMIAEVEGMIYDGSVKTQLSKLTQSLKGEI